MFEVFLEHLEDEICCFGTDTATCGFCKAEHGELVPDDESIDETISIGEFAGRTYVWGCRCENFRKYAKFLYLHRDVIAGALKHLSKSMDQESKKISELLGLEAEGRP